MVSASLAVSYRVYRVNSLESHLLCDTSGLSLATRELVMFIYLTQRQTPVPLRKYEPLQLCLLIGVN